MKRLFLLAALFTLACANENAPSLSDPGAPEGDDAVDTEAPSVDVGHQNPSATGTPEKCPGAALGATCEPAVPECTADITSDPDNCGACGNSCGGGSCVEGTCHPTVLYTGAGDGEHWLAVAGGRLLFADASEGEVLAVSRASGDVSVVAEQQSKPSWIGADGERAAWATNGATGGGLQLWDLRTGQTSVLAAGIDVPDSAVLGSGMVIWHDWTSGSIVGVVNDEPNRVVMLVNDGSAHAPALSDGYLYFASERDGGSIRRVDLQQDLETGDQAADQLVIGALGQTVPKFGAFATRDLQVADDGGIWFVHGTAGGSVWRADASGSVERVGEVSNAHDLTISGGLAYWVTDSGSEDARDGTLWATPLQRDIPAAESGELVSAQPRAVATQLGWVDHLAIVDGVAYFTTTRTAGLFSLEQWRLDTPAPGAATGE